MGMTAARLRERRAAANAVLPRPAPLVRQLTAEERIERLREENRALRKEIAELKAVKPTVEAAQIEAPEPQEVVKPEQPRDSQQKANGKRRG